MTSFSKLIFHNYFKKKKKGAGLPAAKKIMKIVVTGINYIGLSLAVVLAQKHEVWVVDSSVKKIADINAKKCPFSNNGISRMLSGKELNLAATIDMQKACEDADYIIVATQATSNSEINYFDTSAVDKMIKRITKYNDNALVAIRATVPVGYTKKLCKEYGSERFVCYPEFIRDKQAVKDTAYPTRIMIGVSNTDKNVIEKTEQLVELLKDVSSKKNVTSIISSTEEAEAAKLFVNSYMAMRASFFDDIEAFVESQNLDGEKVLAGICAEPGIGNNTSEYNRNSGTICVAEELHQDVPVHKPKTISSAPERVDASRSRIEFINELLDKNESMTVGIYMLSKYKRYDSLKQYDIENIIKSLVGRGKKIVIFDPSIKDYAFCGSRVIHGIDNFKSMSDIIIAEKVTEELSDVTEKVFTPSNYIKINKV